MNASLTRNKVFSVVPHLSLNLSFNFLISVWSLRKAESSDGDRNMNFRSAASCLLLLLFSPLGAQTSKDQGNLSALLKGLDLSTGDKPQLQNTTSVLISKVLQAVECAERTGMTQNTCKKVKPTFVPRWQTEQH